MKLATTKLYDIYGVEIDDELTNTILVKTKTGELIKSYDLDMGESDELLVSIAQDPTFEENWNDGMVLETIQEVINL